MSPTPQYPYAPAAPTAPDPGPFSGAAGAAAGGLEGETRPSIVPPVVGLFAVMTSLVALGTAWYSISVTLFILRAGIDFSFFGCSVSVFGLGVPCETLGVGGAFGPVRQAMLPALLLVVVSVLLLTLSPILLFARKASPKLGGALMLLAGMLLIAAPLVVMNNVQPAFSQAPFLQPGLIPGVDVGADGPWNSFTGSSTWGGMPVSWGPGTGWYASFFAAAFALLAGFMSVAGKPGPSSVTPPAAPQAYAPVYGPAYVYGQPAYSPYGPSASAPQPAYYGPGGMVAGPAQGPPTKNCASCGTLNWAASASCGSCGAPMGA